jgi:hypothetical protein
VVDENSAVASEREPMMRRYALRDDQWERIEGLLPGRDGHVGVIGKPGRIMPRLSPGPQIRMGGQKVIDKGIEFRSLID